MRQKLEQGFTLIELVVVIVILGILAAVAIPQFTDLSGSAKTAVGQAACGALQSTAVMLYGSSQTPTAYASISSQVSVQSGTSTAGTFSGSCAAPIFTPNAPSTAVSCTPLSATFCS